MLLPLHLNLGAGGGGPGPGDPTLYQAQWRRPGRHRILPWLFLPLLEILRMLVS